MFRAWKFPLTRCTAALRGFLACAGLLLLTLSAAGWLLGSPRDEHSLWQYRKRVQAGASFQLDDAILRVHHGTTHSDGRRIGITENWLQYLLGTIYSPLSRTQNAELLIAGGAGDCSERSAILKSICEAAGRRCRFVGLHGHVVLEVNESGRWRTADADYGVGFPVAIRALEKSESAGLIRERLTGQGYSAATIDRYLEIVQSSGDNVVLGEGSPLSPRLAALESSCQWLIWLLPITCLIAGAVGHWPAAAAISVARYLLIRSATRRYQSASAARPWSRQKVSSRAR